MTVQTAARLEALVELQKRCQWVCYCLEPDKSDPTRMTKVPYNAQNGYKASTTNPKHWSTYEQAINAHKNAKNVDGKPFNGIGYVFNRDITGIDCDHCIDEHGNIDTWAQEIIDEANSYAELSPGQEGIHILLFGLVPLNDKGKHAGRKKGLPGMRHPKAAIEMYSEGRFFTITGNRLPDSPTTIEDRQEQLLAIHARMYTSPQQKRPSTSIPPALSLSDNELIDKAMNARNGNGAKFAALWRGDTSEYQGDESRADAALCQLLAFWTGRDASRIDSLFRRSGLHREKWDRATSGSTYGRITIERAIDLSTDVYTPQASDAGYNGNGHHHHEGITDEAPLPEVVIAGQMREYIDASLKALAMAEKRKQTLFVQSARLVKVGHDEQKRPIIIHVGVAELRNALTRSANYFRLKEKSGEFFQVETAPPKDLAEALLALNPSEWPFPALEAIVETPVLRPDFTILDIPGYDAATRLYYIPQKDLKVRKVPLQPSRKEVEQAVALLDEALGEFPYVDQADKANAYAAEMTPIVRPAIRRHIPLGLIDAPKPGTGKGLLADTVALTTTGKTASILTASDSEDEWDKRITAMLMQGRSIICIDNITGKLQSAALDATLTADEKEGRILGLSKMIQVPNRATWLATGNNIKLGGDLPRRCYRIRLDPHVSRPWMRTGFKHEDLASWVTEHRGELIAAVLTLARAWFVAGQPLDKNVPALGTFTNWAKMLGGILKFAGINGFLSNLEKLYEEADEDSAQWEAFLQSWLETFGNEYIKTSEVILKLNASNNENAGSVAGSCLLDALPESLQFVLKDKPNSFAIRLGKALERRLETCYGNDNLRLERTVDKGAKQKLWRVVAGSAGSATTHARSEKSVDTLSTTQNYKSDNGLDNYPHYPQTNTADKASNEVTSQSNGVLKLAGSPTTLPATGLGKRCGICKRSEAVVWWPDDVPRCQECKEKAEDMQAGK